MRWPAAVDEKFDGAFDWNLARTLGIGGFRGPFLRAREARVLATLLGAWRASGVRGCQPLRGRHPAACPHSANRVPVRVGVIAERIFGHNGGSQRRQVRAALDVLATTPVGYRVMNAGGDWELAHPPRPLVKAWTPDADDDRVRGLLDLDLDLRVDLIVSFDAPLLRSMLAGHLQRVPLDLVQGLDDSSFLIWLAGLCQVPQRGAFTRWIPFTGGGPWVTKRQLGLPGSTRGELEAAVERAAARGHALQQELRLEITTLPPRRRSKRERRAFRVVRVPTVGRS